MDSLTQIVLGASVGQMVLGNKEKNRALLWGAIAGTIPDLDVFIVSKSEIAMNMSYHRGFSHSIFFAILFAPIIAYFVKLISKKSESNYWDWIRFFFWTIVTHPILDTFTSYGTQFLSPISDFQFSFHVISVIDFFYTLPYFLCVFAILFINKHQIRQIVNLLGFSISSIYLLFTFANKFYIESVFIKELDSQNITYEKIISSPTLLNNFLWNVSAIAKDSIYFTNISNFDKKNQEILRFAKNHNLIANVDNYDINRIIWKAESYFIVEVLNDDELLISDVRFGFDFISNRFLLNYKVKKDSLNIVQGGFAGNFSKSELEERIHVLLTRIQGLK